MKELIRTFSLITAALVLFTQCETERVSGERSEPNRTVEPRECFDYVYPIMVVMEGETIEVQDVEHYTQLHLRCATILENGSQSGDPKGRDDSNQSPTGKGSSSSDYGDCPRDNDPWCGAIIFPVTLTNVPYVEGDVVVSNDSTLQYYRWVLCD